MGFFLWWNSFERNGDLFFNMYVGFVIQYSAIINNICSVIFKRFLLIGCIDRHLYLAFKLKCIIYRGTRSLIDSIFRASRSNTINTKVN